MVCNSKITPSSIKITYSNKKVTPSNMKITYNNSTQRHYLRRDDQKLKECDSCNLFSKCMFLKYNELIKEVLEKLVDKSS